MNKKNKFGFTLVELLAVIVILAIILVIAVPKVMSVIEDAKKATLESTAKMIASQAEKAKVQNTLLGKTESITCKDITNINDVDYADCDIVFDNNTAKVTIAGSGKFEGLYVCNGTKTESTATKDSCTPVVNATNFTDDDWATIVAAVQSGNHPYEVGNTKTVDMGSLGTHAIRVANTTPCSEVTVESQTACGFVLEFAGTISTYLMNDIDTNVGGWPASEMRTYVNNDIYNSLPEELRNGIIDTYVVSSHGSGDVSGELENDNFGSTDKLYLLSTEEVWAQGGNNAIYDDTSRGTSRRLDYYAKNKVSTTNGSGAKKTGANDYWWLRSAISFDGCSFFTVRTDGDWYNYTAGNGYGVSPAFRLAD